MPLPLPTKHPTRRGLPPGRGALIGLVLATICLSGLAQEPGATRIGYVDMKRLFDNAPQVLAARESLDQEFRPRNEALLADEARLEVMHQRLSESGDADPESRFDMEREVRNLRRSIDRRREDLSEELRFRTNTEKKALEETIEVAVQQVAESRGFDLVLTSPVAYASASVDITDLILDWLEADFPARQARNR